MTLGSLASSHRSLHASGALAQFGVPDQTSRVGCGLCACSDVSWFFFLFVCFRRGRTLKNKSRVLILWKLKYVTGFVVALHGEVSVSSPQFPSLFSSLLLNNVAIGLKNITSKVSLVLIFALSTWREKIWSQMVAHTCEGTVCLKQNQWSLSCFVLTKDQR